MSLSPLAEFMRGWWKPSYVEKVENPDGKSATCNPQSGSLINHRPFGELNDSHYSSEEDHWDVRDGKGK
jgi:hypothetical protein